MATLLFRSRDLHPSAALISKFRALTRHSIADIRDRIARGVPLIEITPFRNDWQELRHVLVRLSRGIEDGSLPLAVTESLDGVETEVSPAMLRNLSQRYRAIELETQMQTELELGEIDDLTKFHPDDNDWISS